MPLHTACSRVQELHHGTWSLREPRAGSPASIPPGHGHREVDPVAWRPVGLE
jgi:hypothetical protein